MENKDLFQQLRELKLPGGKYAVFGSGPICIRGWRNCSHDLDIIAIEGVWNECLEKKEWELRKMDHGSEYLCNNNLELWKDWQPGQWDIEKLIKEAEIIKGMPFVRLERVIEWKKLSGREKDLKDIEIIERFLPLLK